MTKELQDLFDGLNKLTETSEAFYFSEQDYGEHHVVRSFTYRLASWTDFQEPYAKESRGTAFVLDKRTQEWSLFCRAYPKSHNLGEGISKDEFIEDNEILGVYEKLDGSLILVGIIEEELVAKSKTSLNSEQAQLAQELIDNSKVLRTICKDAISVGYTPVFELVGRKNKIVLNYNCDAKLVSLGDVNHQDGHIFRVRTEEDYKSLSSSNIHIAKPYTYTWKELLEIQETSKPDIEGFIVETAKGDVKVKVLSYVHLHHLKDNINNMKSLIGIILADDVDDLIGSFRDDQETIDIITEVQEKVSHRFNHLVVEYKELRRKYFQDFRENRKEFALKHSKDALFGAVMRTLKESFKDVEKVAEAQIKDYILRLTKTQSLAETWLND